MNRKIVVAVVVTTFVVAFSLGYSLSLFYPSNQSQDENQLTIASLEKEVMGNLSSHLSMIIENSRVEENKVLCAGTVYWLGGEYIVSNARVCMFITRNQTNSANAEVVVYGGGLLLPTGTIDSDSVQIPTLGEQILSFDFSLSCTYSEP